ncbi:MAG TPA: aminoacyl-tRNA hydrolase [Candidatus Paceibacterota bacterium]
MKIKIIAGLGNPGPEYEKTYHNLGLLFIQQFIAKYEGSIRQERLYGYSKITKNEKEIIAIKPLTFMNDSGRPIKEAMKKFNCHPEELIVVHDDADLKIGNYKLSFGSGSAGHNGINSIIKSIGTKDFYRLRIGIRDESPADREKAGEIVLKQIPKNHQVILDKTINKILEDGKIINAF